MKKKQACQLLAAFVSVCFLVCLITAVQSARAALQMGVDIPFGYPMLALVTGFCAVVIWKGVREMDD